MRINSGFQNQRPDLMKGVTLLELLIAISLTSFIIMAGSGIYLSGMNLTEDARYAMQASRNAQIVIMHIEKYARRATTDFNIADNGKTVSFCMDLSTEPSSYSFSNHSITFTQSGSNNVVFNHIEDCTFSVMQNDGVALRVEVKAYDNRDENTCMLSALIQGSFSKYPSDGIIN